MALGDRSEIDPSRDREVAATPVDVNAVERSFAVFRRPREARDIVPALQENDGMRFGAAFQVDRSRLVAGNERHSYYVLPARTSDGTSVCVLSTDTADGGIGGGCSPLDLASSATDPYGSTTTRAGGSQEVFFLLPDGVERMNLELRDGQQLSQPVRDNAILVTVRPGVKAVSWTDAEGRRHAEILRDDPLDTTD